MRELVELVTEMPPDDAGQARGHKMPFQATQLLTEGGDGVKDIVEAFFYSYRPKEPEKSETAPPNEDTLDLADPSFLGQGSLMLHGAVVLSPARGCARQHEGPLQRARRPGQSGGAARGGVG